MIQLREHRPGRAACGAVTFALLSLGAALLSEAAPAAPSPGAARSAPAAGRRLAAVPTVPGTAPAPAAPLQYNRDVRPILSENCFACHGPDSAARKAGLRLDRPADATTNRSGRAAIVPRSPATSEMIRRIQGDGPVMPPHATRKELTPRQIATLKRWVAEGAVYERHWSYIAPVRPAVPSVGQSAWVRTPIDAFVLARLEAAGLKPAPEADARTLARRLSLDLTGLPPAPAEVEAFVKDSAADREGAYSRLVDRLLASPHWGEHRGRYWLDAARYADTHGIHFDNYREMWSYRDWVMSAFNRNLPFDQFTIEQLAGDLLPKPTLEQVIATGFNRCNITTNEGGVIQEEYAVLYNRDRTETTAAVWLGTTAGCAVCHDHKFDPLSQREFYAMAAFFNNTTQNVMDGNIKDPPPIIPVPLPEDRARFQALQAELKEARAQGEARKQGSRPDFDRWLAGDRSGVAASIPSERLALHLPLAEGKGRELRGSLRGAPLTLTAAADPTWAEGQVSALAFQRRPAAAVEIPQAGDFERDQSYSFAAWVRINSVNQTGAVFSRLDDEHDYRGWDLWVENGRVGTHMVHRWPQDALKVMSRQQLKQREWHHVCVTYTGAGSAGGVRLYIDGAPAPADVPTNALRGTLRTGVPFKIGQRHTASGLDNAGIQDVRLYERALDEAEVRALARGTRAVWLASGDPAKLSAGERDELFSWWLPGQDAPYRSLTDRMARLENEERTMRLRGTIAHVAQEKSAGAMAYILYRGEYDKRRDEVKPETPEILPPLPPDFPKNRLGFARWLLLPEHPLTARVTVNRFWQELYGQGIVRTPGDFGVSGELPSHPELLDWLAVEFREGGWDIKKLFRLLVTSATYRQAAVTTPEKQQKDPQNRLLSRGARFRMDAEMVRDYALAASGLLARKLGGPSVRPYQPDGVWEAVAMIGSNTRDYRRDTGENLYRRSMYTFWKRAAPPASMEIFNAPNRETCAVRRERTNTPLQALVTLNDVQFVEAARQLAQQALREGGSAVSPRLDYVFHRLLARDPTPRERALVLQSLGRLEGYYLSQPDAARQLLSVGESPTDASLPARQVAAWTMLVNQLMNLDEVLNK